MSLNEQWLRYGESDQRLGYAAWQERAPGNLPAVIVIQEIWGVDEHIKDVTRRFANAGYFAFAPDLFAHAGERVEHLKADEISEAKTFLESIPRSAWRNDVERAALLKGFPEEKQQQMQATIKACFSSTDPELHIDQLVDTVTFLHAINPNTKDQAIFSVGFCMGGALSGLLSTRTEHLNGAVIFYGNPIKEEAIPDVACPILGFYGELDTNITGKIPDFAESLRNAGKLFEHTIYSKTEHAFFNDTRAAYNVDAARDAFARTLLFFNRLQKNIASR